MGCRSSCIGEIRDALQENPEEKRKLLVVVSSATGLDGIKQQFRL
jgi:hypothetical protein